jgi:hypothetical protein
MDTNNRLTDLNNSHDDLEILKSNEDKELFFESVMSEADPEPNDALDKAGRLYQEYFNQS